MSNCYTHSCFVLWITAAESALLREAIGFAEFLDEEAETEAIAEHWLGLSETFRAAFPPVDDDPVSGFLAIYPDSGFPTFGTSFAFDEQDDGTIQVFATADQFEPDAVTGLLHRSITQSLPVMVTWSYDSDRYH